PQHPDLVGQSRVTIWEIHPILKIEAFRSGAWVDLDAMPSPRFSARRPQMAPSPTFHTKSRERGSRLIRSRLPPRSPRTRHSPALTHTPSTTRTGDAATSSRSYSGT